MTNKELTMKNLILLLILFSFQKVNASLPPEDTNIRYEGWIKFTCIGVTTPQAVHPVVIEPIMVAHLKVDPYQPYPALEDLRDQNAAFFDHLTKTCTEQRWAMTDLSRL